MAIEVSKWQPRGPIAFAPIDTSTTPYRPGVFGGDMCADQISLALTIDYTTHDSKCQAIVSEDYRGIKKATGEATISLSDLTLEAMVMGLSATSIEAEASPAAEVSEELTELPDAGGRIALGGSDPNFNITALTIEDSASPPVSLTLGDDYTVVADFGMVIFGDLSGFTQPLKASYSHANPAIMGALAAGTITRWGRFNGINAARGSKILPVDMFNLQISPTSGLDFLPDDLGNLELKCGVLLDQSRSSNDPRGQFFSVGRAA